MTLPTKKVIIIGGGVSGLVSAYSSIQAGKNVTLYEKDNHLGGLIGTQRTENGLIEQAANGFLNSYFTEKLANDLSLKLLKPNPAAKKRLFFRNLKIHKLPISLFHLIRAIYGFFFIDSEPRDGESMDDWSQRIFGSEFTHFIVEPAIGGIYSTELKFMYLPMVFSKFVFYKNRSLLRNIILNRKVKIKNNGKIPKPKIRGLVSFSNGMQELIEGLKSFIETKAEIQLNKDISSVEDLIKQSPGNEIRICTSLRATYEIIQNWNFAKEILNIYNIEKLEFQSIATITRFGNDTIFPFPAFGILFPRGEGIKAKGVLANHSIFPGRVKDLPYSETWIQSGDWIQNVTNNELIEQLNTDRDILYSSKINLVQNINIKFSNNMNQTSGDEIVTSKIYSSADSQIHIKIWKNAFPIYNKNLYKFNQCLDEIESVCESKGISLRFLGNYRRGIGLRSLIENSMKV